MLVNSVVAAILGIVGLAAAFSIYRNVASQPAGNERMQEIADAIYEGAMAFLKREYQILSIFVLAVFGLLVWKVAVQTGVAFLAGASCSVLAGYLGMQAATKANVRTSQAAMAEGEGAALLVAFNGGAVMSGGFLEQSTPLRHQPETVTGIRIVGC